jgi:hypothetical protein
MYGEHYLNVFFLVKILFSIDGSLFLHIPDVRFDIKNKIASLYSLQTKLSFWSSFIQQCEMLTIYGETNQIMWIKLETQVHYKTVEAVIEFVNLQLLSYNLPILYFLHVWLNSISQLSLETCK